MSVTILALQDLSCGHCVKSVTTALEKIPNVESVQVTLHFAKVVGDVNPQTLIDAVIDAGYQAQLAQPNFELALSGLNCGHCIQATEKALSAVENVDVFDVTKTSAKIYGSADPQLVIAAIIDAGFDAQLSTESPKPELPTQPVVEPAPVVVVNENQENMTAENTVSLLLDGLSCAACVLKVERALQGVPNVQQARVNLAEQMAFVTGEAEPQGLIQAVINAGYGAELIENETERRAKQQAQAQAEIRQRKWQSFVALIVGFGLLFWGLLGGQTQVNSENQGAWIIVGVITLIVMIFTGGHFYQRAAKNLLKKTATMDTLVALGTGAGWLFSMSVAVFPHFFPETERHLYFESSAMIIGLINLGKMLEVKAKQHSSKALEHLLDLTPKTARVADEQGEREIPLTQVKQGMILRVQTGDRVSVDGIVTQGSAWLDESMLTGEPLPVQKYVGDKISAGTLVTDGSLLFRAEQIGNQTTLAHIIKLVRQAQNSKPQIAQLVDKIAAVFVPVVVAIALLAALIWYFVTKEISYSFIVLTTVLIIACPCALGLATPMSIIAGVGRAAELGVLVRDADALQKAASADTLVFDKTGTLTKGEPKVTALYTYNETTQQSAVRFAAVLEQGANHPLAKAILALNNEHLDAVAEFKTLKGLGVTGRLNGKKLALGNRTLMTQLGVATAQAESQFQQESEKGATVVFLAVENQLAAIFAIRDPLRDDSQAALQRLRVQGYHLVMLTGDQEKTAQAIADEVGIDHVIAGILPDAKAQAIQQLQQQGRRVVMVGDGINDAPALAQADVSMAIGSGSDIAIETAELTLMHHSIHAVADALSLSKATLRNMKQNLFFAFIYNSLGIPFAAGVFYPLFGWLLNPMIGGAAMACSSITVATNANRLLKFTPKA
ncbi:Cu+-exporting ATPase [Pasteurella langaaensis DSM 22999]|uniref:Copper-exporting P-type ATPase n=1 Tax=Alitibacter langaaensis DSM 22999 TaxID=1122935 RepID=A0A2U0SMV8_9PAST|nr:copper-translocating P-type ATPase [Pasteurella langaaensis]PVX32686.1 Cu+-exporting ATPase [Pasteurella langaaensis DSM 22999]